MKNFSTRAGALVVLLNTILAAGSAQAALVVFDASTPQETAADLIGQGGKFLEIESTHPSSLIDVLRLLEAATPATTPPARLAPKRTNSPENISTGIPAPSGHTRRTGAEFHNILRAGEAFGVPGLPASPDRQLPYPQPGQSSQVADGMDAGWGWVTPEGEVQTEAEDWLFRLQYSNFEPIVPADAQPLIPVPEPATSVVFLTGMACIALKKKLATPAVS